MKRVSHNFEQMMLSIIHIGNKSNNTVAFCLAKLLEETGEFSQAALAKNRDISIKKLKHKNQVFEEACDAFIMILDTVGHVYKKDIAAGKLTELDLIYKLFDQVPKKIKKWKKITGL